MVKSFPATDEGIAASQAFLESFDTIPRSFVVLDEVVSNIVRCSGASGFSLDISRADEGLKIVFSDDGRAFDPTMEVAEPDVAAAAPDRPIGGLGMFMVRKLSQSVRYERDGERNVLTVVMAPPA